MLKMFPVLGSNDFVTFVRHCVYFAQIDNVFKKRLKKNILFKKNATLWFFAELIFFNLLNLLKIEPNRSIVIDL